MGKGVQVALLCLVFTVFTAAGYFFGDVILNDDDVKTEVVEETVETSAPVISTVPVIPQGGVSAPKRASNGTYSFTAQAYVESGDQLIYFLYADAEATQEVQKNLDGNFTGIPASVSGTYYLLVQNPASRELSTLYPVGGFAAPRPSYKKITVEELHQIINIDHNFSSTEKGFNKRISPNLNIVVSGANENDVEVHTLEDVCKQVKLHLWSSVIFGTPSYDDQGRLSRLPITVNY